MNRFIERTGRFKFDNSSDVGSSSFIYITRGIVKVARLGTSERKFRRRSEYLIPKRQINQFNCVLMLAKNGLFFIRKQYEQFFSPYTEGQ